MLEEAQCSFIPHSLLQLLLWDMGRGHSKSHALPLGYGPQHLEEQADASVFRLERVFGGWSEGRGVFLVHWPIVIMLMTRNNTHGHPSPRAPPGIAPAKSFICLSDSKSQSNPRSKGYCIPPFP